MAAEVAGDGVEVQGVDLGVVVNVAIAQYSPAFFEGAGKVAALDAKYAYVSASNAAGGGDLVQLFVNGLGPVSNQPASGERVSASKRAKSASGSVRPLVMK